MINVRQRQQKLVGVRELRQNLSVHLDRVKAGETLQVTEFGRVVAILAPLPAERLSLLERMVHEGRATAPTRSLKGLPLPTPGHPDAPSTESILEEMREERL